jgi:hypothetical protein
MRDFVVFCGGMMLALVALGGLMSRAKRVPGSNHQVLPEQHLLPCVYRYKDITLSLN